MNMVLIKDAIEEAIYVLNEEFESVINDEVAAKYEVAITKLKNALDSLNE